MSKNKPIVANTPEELASSLGLSSVAAKEWNVQRVLLKPQGDCRPREDHACGLRKTSGDFANQGDCDSER